MAGGTIRVLVVLAAFLTPVAGCLVGPQSDFPVDPGEGAADGDRGGDDDDPAAEPPDADAGAGGEDPGDTAQLPDDGDFGADEGEAADGDADTDSAAPDAEDLKDEVVPGVPTIPRPGWPSPRPEEPPFDTASDAPGLPGDFGLGNADTIPHDEEDPRP